MTFAKLKVKIRMRRKAWRPLNIGCRIYLPLRNGKYAIKNDKHRED